MNPETARIIAGWQMVAEGRSYDQRALEGWPRMTEAYLAECERSAYWRRCTLGTWAVNLALSAWVAWLLWTR